MRLGQNEEAQRKIAEKDQLIEQMNKRIELLHRQADSKSQQLQGELEEASIFSRLQEHFPADELVRVPRQERCRHRVQGQITVRQDRRQYPHRGKGYAEL